MGKVYLNVKVGNKPESRIAIDLFDDIEIGIFFSKASKIESGQFVLFAQTEGKEISFKRSMVRRHHACAGVVSVSRNDKKSLSITLGKAGFLDSKFTVIGHIVDGMDVIADLDTLPTESNGKPRVEITMATPQAEEKTEEAIVDKSEMPTGSNSARLVELRLKMNKAKQLNNQAVLMEKKRLTDPKAYMQSLSLHNKVDEVETNPLLHQTAEMASRGGAKQSKETFAWDMFNEDSLYKAHDKRVDQMGFYPDAYERQKEEMGDQFFQATNVGHEPSDDAKERLADSIRVAGQKRKEFSRRRVQNDDNEDILWINEKNKQFTKRIERAFGEHTAEIKANLERGTAL